MPTDGACTHLSRVEGKERIRSAPSRPTLLSPALIDKQKKPTLLSPDQNGSDCSVGEISVVDSSENTSTEGL